jgi:maleylacetoacetate isomerase
VEEDKPQAKSSLPRLVLHASARSSCSQRVRIALRLKQLPFLEVAVDLDRREQEGESFRSLHPLGQVPVLVADGIALGQSLAILEWLQECWPERGTALLPVDPLQRQRAREIALIVTSLIQPFQLPGATRRHLIRHMEAAADPATTQELLQRFSRDHMERTLVQLESLLSGTRGRFSVGDTPTLADCCVVPQLEAAARLGVDVNRYYHLAGVFEQCRALEAFVAPEPTPSAATVPSSAPSSASGGTALTPALALRHKEPAAAVLSYLRDEANDPIAELEAVRAETCRLFPAAATKMTPLDVCLLLGWLVRGLGVKRAVEVGVFTGSSSLAIAANLPPDGRLIAFDPDAETSTIARHAWQRAGLNQKIELHLEDAGRGLPALAADADLAGQIDLAFIDGPNEAYGAHYELLLPLLRQGGLLVFDNTLWKGEVLRADSHDPRAQALRRLNRELRDDPRVHSCTLSLGDGLTLAIKR